MKIKKCKGPCGLRKNISEFRIRKGRKNPQGMCKKCEKKYHKKYRENYHTEIVLCKKKYYIRNRTRLLKKQKLYAQRNKEKRQKYERKRKNNDICYRIACNLRNRFYHAIKNNYKTGSAIRDLGCSIKKLKTYIENQFYTHSITKEPMTWKNYGKQWHIDHIRPLCSFDLAQKEQVKKACHYTNLRPLWKIENLAKSAEDKKKSVWRKILHGAKH